MSSRPTEIDASVAAAASCLAGARRLGLGCHVNPDGDALGSMLGMLAVVPASIETWASFPAPYRLHPSLRWLPGAERIVRPADVPDGLDAFVTFDCGSEDRLHELVPVMHSARDLIVIDHHTTNTSFGTVNVVEATAAATSVVVAAVLEAAGWGLTPTAATCLYAALVSDTGGFRFAATDARAFRLAARLVEAGAAVASISDRLDEPPPLGYLRLLADLLSRAEYEEDISLLWVTVGSDDLARHGLLYGDTDSVVDELRRAREPEVVCVVRELPHGGVKASLRSVTRDVAVLAARHGGGGHQRAAGFSAATVAEALAAVRAGVG